MFYLFVISGLFLDLSGTVVTYEHLFVSVLDLSEGYSQMLMNSDLY